jgi:uncharacterized membrane protein
MFTLLKLVHLLALVFAATASLGNIYLFLSAGPHDLAAPGFTNRLRVLYRMTALGAVIAFWISGLLMLVFGHGFWVDGVLFGIKFGLAILISLSVIFLNVMAGGWARGGGPPSYVKTLHWMNAIVFLLIVTTSALIFS